MRSKAARHPFTLIEVMIVIVLVGIFSSVAAFAIKPLYLSYRFRVEVESLYDLLQEIQLEALTLQSDMHVSFTRKNEKWIACSRSDESIIKPQTIDLSHVETIEEGKQITFFSNGLIDPPISIKFSNNKDERWIDFTSRHLIKFWETKPNPSPLESEPNILNIKKLVEKMELSSSAFKNKEPIPEKYTCEGKEINPPLSWTDVPPKTASLVLIMDDPDVPSYIRKDQMWVHWVIYNIPPTVTEILENASSLPGVLGKGTEGKMAYQGPCPPDREHRYFFKLYALDALLKLPPGATKKEVEQKMARHVIAKSELIGVYCKKSNQINS